jgi:hypothetical protein
VSSPQDNAGDDNVFVVRSIVGFDHPDGIFMCKVEWEIEDGGSSVEDTKACHIFGEIERQLIIDYLKKHHPPTNCNQRLPKGEIECMIVDKEVDKGNVKFMIEGSTRVHDAYYLCNFRPSTVIRFLSRSGLRERIDGNGRKLTSIAVDDQEPSDEALIAEAGMDSEFQGHEVDSEPNSQQLHRLRCINRLPETDGQILEVLLPELAELHVKSRCLSKLPPFAQWHSNQKTDWRKVIAKHTLWMKEQLDIWNTNKDPLLLLNICLRCLAVPVDLLIPVTSLNDYHDEVTVFVDNSELSWVIPRNRAILCEGTQSRQDGHLRPCNEEDIVNSAADMIRRGRPNAQISKVLDGNGVARRTSAVAQCLSDMHPHYGETIQPFDTQFKNSVSLDIGKCAAKLRRDAGKTKNIDVFGWTPDLLACLRNLLPSERGMDFFKVHAMLTAALGDTANVPNAVAFMVSAGYMTPLNKISPKGNEEKIRNGLTPVIRPVNSGVTQLKNLGQCALDSNGGKLVNRRLPEQYQGVSDGVGKVIAFATGAYRQRKCIQKKDAVSAFNNMARAAVIDGSKHLWKEGYPLYHKYYGMVAPIFFLYRDDDGKRCLRVIFSHEGVRQGCSLASIGYGMAAERRIYGPIREAHPESGAAAITDDHINVWDPPSVNSQHEWEIWYDKVALYLADFAALAAKVGIKLADDKGMILIPHDGFLPLSSIRSNSVKLNVTKDGIIIAGTPIGTREYTKSVLQAKVKNVQRRGVAVCRLKDEFPQYCVPMLTRGVNVGLDYLVSMVAPHRWDELLSQFDDFMFHRLLEVAQVDSPSLDLRRTSISRRLARLPPNFNGVGLVASKTKAPVAFLCRMMAVARDPKVIPFAESLKPDVRLAYSELCHLTGSSCIQPGHTLSAVLPPQADLMFDLTFAPPALATFRTTGRSKVIMSFLHAGERIALMKRVLKLSNKSDKIHLLTILSRSQLSRVFSSNLGNRTNRIGADGFRYWLSFYLNLPFPSGLAFGSLTRTPDFDYPVAKCLLHGKAIDANGDHASSCTLCHGPRHTLHYHVNSVISHFAIEAGFQVKREPSVEAVIGPLASDLSSLFPKKSSKANNRAQDAIKVALDHGPTAVKEALARLPRVPESEQAALRPDLLLLPNDGKGEAFVIDGAAVHSSCKSYVKHQLPFLVQAAVQEISLFADGLRPSVFRDNSPAVVAVIRKKVQKYGLMVELSNLKGNGVQTSGCRKTFVAAVLSHRGELSLPLLDLVEYFTGRFKRAQRRVFDINGLTVAMRAANFRADFKNSLMFRLAESWGVMLQWSLVRGSA